MNNRLHIISWDIPYPADYGGVIDVYHTLRHLHAAGIQIVLHVFSYGGRSVQAPLENLCAEVHTYPRKTGLSGLHTSLPYIVSSRHHKDLLKNLKKDEAPILFEGIHTTLLLDHPDLKDRHKVIRIQNIEQDYYRQLATHTKSFFKQLYYHWESARLYRYERNLRAAQAFVTVAMQDHDFFKALYPKAEHTCIPSFQPYDTVASQIGKGEYVLYHGNLSVAENIRAALFLAREVFQHLHVPLRIAGKNPPPELLVCKNEYIQIIANPDDETLHQLISNAQINILPGFQNTGLKLKLLHALFAGRHCLCNEIMLTGTGLNATVQTAETAEDFRQKIKTFMDIPFDQALLDLRKESLVNYNNSLNAERLINTLHLHYP
ncbi:MAG: mannosyltransferase [Chitinophagaceae bacterium]|nr:mannosyltransferase [Chitinophagaceae bacterium]